MFLSPTPMTHPHVRPGSALSPNDGEGTAAGGSHWLRATPQLIVGFGPAAAFDPTDMPDMRADTGLVLIHLDAGRRPLLSWGQPDDLWPILSEAGRDTVIVCMVGSVFMAAMGMPPPDHRAYHLPDSLRAMAVAFLEGTGIDRATPFYRSAKIVELLCEAARHGRHGLLLPLNPGNDLTAADSHRLLSARQMIQDRFRERLTLDAIARACGLNRAKLTMGFRELFCQSVAEAITSARLREAARLLRNSSMPVSSVGYEVGYSNNAAFTRAFARHFGTTPSTYRLAPVSTAPLLHTPS